MKASYLKALFKSSIGIIGAAFFGLIAQKYISVQMGPIGLGEFGLLRQFLQVGIVILTLGGGSSIVAEWQKSRDKEDFERIISTYIWTFIALCSFLSLFLSPYISRFLFNDDFHQSFFQWSFVIFIFISINTYFRFLMTAKGQIGISSLNQILPFVYMILALFITNNFFFVFTISYGFAALTSIILGRKKIRIQNFFKPKFIRLKSFEKLSITTLATGIIGFSTILIVRSFVSSNLGIYSAGLLESCWSLTNYIGLTYVSILAAYYLPKLAENSENDTLKKNTIILVSSCAMISSIGLLIWGDWALKIFFSNKFTGAFELLKLFTFGDYLKMTNSFFIYTLIALSFKKSYLIFDTINNILFITLTYFILKQSNDMSAVGIAHIISQFIYFLFLTVFVIRKKIINPRLISLTLLFTGLVFLVFIFQNNMILKLF